MQAHQDRLEAVKAKIAALLALAADGSGATPAEAASAAAMATRLMLKYALAEAEIRKAAGEKVNGEYEMRVVRYSASGVSRYLHAQARLMYVLARHNFCTAFRCGSTGEGKLVGEPEMVDLVIELYMRLMPQLLKMGQEAYVAYKAEYLDDGGRPSQLAQEASWRRTHFTAAVATIDNRLARARREAQEAEDAAGKGEAMTALIVVKDTDLAEASQRFVPNSTKGRRSTLKDGAAYRAGMRDGARVNLGQSRKAIGG